MGINNFLARCESRQEDIADAQMLHTRPYPSRKPLELHVSPAFECGDVGEGQLEPFTACLIEPNDP
jgi:hypothetical protein